MLPLDQQEAAGPPTESATSDETETVVHDLAMSTSLPHDYVASVMRDVHYVIDFLVADDVNVLLGPLYFVRRGDPVVAAVVKHFTIEDWRNPEGLKSCWTRGALAEALHLSPAEVHAHRFVFGSKLMSLVAEWRDVPKEGLLHNQVTGWVRQPDWLAWS